MPRTNILTVTFLAVLTLALATSGQNKAAESGSKSTSDSTGLLQPEKQHFYYHSWAKNEFKVCQTYSGTPNLVLCDSDDDMQWRNSFLNMIADNGRANMTEEESYRKALEFAASHGKTFLASFTEDPWPKPQTGIKATVWNCSKDKGDVVRCERAGQL
jgi:hypothetical protein